MSVIYARIRGLHQSVKVKEIKKYLAPIRPLDIRVLKNGLHCISCVYVNSILSQGVGRIVFKREQDYIVASKKTGKIHGKGVTIGTWNEKSREESVIEELPKPSWPVQTAEELKTAILESGRLFVRNLSYECTEEKLEQLFAKYGSLSDIHLSYDPVNHTPKGFAFVTYMFPTDAVTAFTKLDKTKFMNRLLHILPAEEAPEPRPKPRANDGDSATELHRSSFQVTHQETLKATAGVAHNWNALFIRPDAVATYLAAKFGLTKEQVLNPAGRGGSVAVRLAHAEAQLVAEMREFLQQNGINLDAFEQQTESNVPTEGRRDRLEAQSSSTARQLSGTAFLIKNLPVGTTETEVRDLIRQHTNPRARFESDPRDPIRPKKVIIPPLGITAIVVFSLPQHARLAYRLLAYEPFQDSVLYLQWLPHGAWKSDAEEQQQENQKDREQNASSPIDHSKQQKRRRKHGHIKENHEEPSKSVADAEAEFELITSLSNEDQEQALSPKRRLNRSDFEDVEDDDHDMKNPSEVKTISEKNKKRKPKARGYENKKARIRRQDAQTEENEAPAEPVPVLDDSSTTPKPTQTRVQVDEPEPTKAVLLVRNIPFQATQEELTELFQAVGGLLCVRLPQKPGGGHRGFGFVEFDTIDQANAAKETLGADTHFLGRRLRIEFARG
ncbi:Multiple RNA-binding domain-containing protein 1 [Fasciola gigantica]|uniref:Multiple RNA-binding domain-containing protein 1 n=1 Tax=Fasciola gigantica TaxID=46835 RepID=A0A504YUW8_FASGI|nr:Multiple RNA-binding domain-containing protein 1 [Fasciola gigantica]